MYNFGSFDAFIVKPTILPEICSTIEVFIWLTSCNYAKLEHRSLITYDVLQREPLEHSMKCIPMLVYPGAVP